MDDKGTTLFASLEKYYDSKSDTHAIYLALTVASITMREIPSLTNTHDIQGIASVYYNRFAHSSGNPNYPSDAGTLIQADPTVQYAVATDHPPKAGETWWPNVNDQDLKSIETKNQLQLVCLPWAPTRSNLQRRSPTVFLAAASPISPDNGKLYYYFISGKCDHKTYFATTSDQQNANKAKYIDGEQC